MKGRSLHIIIAYVYHAVLILLSFCMMGNYFDAFGPIAMITAAIYLIYWVVINRKKYMAWIVYLHFLIGSAIQILMNWFDIIPEDSGWFTGLFQLFYIFFLLFFAAVLGITNLILWLIHRHRRKKQSE